MAHAACGGGRGRGRGRGRSALSPLLGCLLVFSLLCLRAVVCRAQEPGHGQLQPRRATRGSKRSWRSRRSKELAFSREARIYQGAIQVSPDTGNVGSYQDIMVNKSGSVLLQRRFTMWRRVDNGSGSATAPRVQSRDEPPPDSYGGYLGLTNATLEANPTPARNCFMAVEFDTTKQDYDPSDNHVGSVVSVKVAGARPRTPRGAPVSPTAARTPRARRHPSATGAQAVPAHPGQPRLHGHDAVPEVADTLVQ
ncbi:unnamed protein product [Miscanthus lutarioriparius]|uniref:Legume lectin domain-containing protein n=1 Tax=Miscanthus lutarioriparius TaxID=422564 RepID=A0A811QTE3_9POAL|nr:unnamed protein product [Miscanthus lutarioriparius]